VVIDNIENVLEAVLDDQPRQDPRRNPFDRWFAADNFGEALANPPAGGVIRGAELEGMQIFRAEALEQDRIRMRENLQMERDFDIAQQRNDNPEEL
jgi:hypothetical protein